MMAVVMLSAPEFSGTKYQYKAQRPNCLIPMFKTVRNQNESTVIPAQTFNLLSITAF
jgi:hypothetical protein